MSRWLACVTALAVAGCSQKTSEPAARLVGTLDIALVGDLLFVTSSDRSELRALDLSRNPRGFVRAPNPLEPLAIPVVERPQRIARDLRYADEPVGEDGAPGRPGQETAGPYVYALGAGGAAISVVNAQREGLGSLTEVGRIIPYASVASMASIGPSSSGQPSRLFVALASAAGTDIVQYDVPPPETIQGKRLEPQHLVSISAEWVNDMIVLPGASVGAEQLAIATRRSQGSGGRTVVLDPQTRSQRQLAFPGPVRLLATHGFSNLNQHPAGQYLYGALDEDACGGAASCRGVIAVELQSGEVPLLTDSSSPRPMPLLTTGEGLPTGLTLVSDASINFPDVGAVLVSLLGVVTTSTGQIILFDAAEKRHFDVNPNGPAPVGIIYRGPPATPGALGESRPYLPGPQVAEDTPEAERIQIADPGALTESILITWGGVLPGLVELPTLPTEGERFAIPTGLSGRVRVGDRIVVVGADAVSRCEVGVAAIEPSALVADQLPSGPCADRRQFSVRAGLTDGFVVVGSQSGYLGRVGPNQRFTSERRVRVAQGDGTVTELPSVQFTMGPEQPSEVGASYTLDIDANVAPFAVTATLDFSGGVHLAGRPVYDRPPHGERPERLFVAFPSADAVVGLNPLVLQRGDRDQKAEFYR